MPFLEHYITQPLITTTKNIKFLMLLVKSHIFGTILNKQNMHEKNLCLNNSYVCWLDETFEMQLLQYV
jgi:hypothetical protein